MKTKFAERIRQQMDLTSHIAQKYGYELSNTDLEAGNNDETLPNQCITLNKLLNPLKKEEKLVKKSEKHAELLKEIDAYEFRKKILAMQKKRSASRQNEDFSMSRALNEKIKEYNYLLDHKHITQKNSEATKKVLRLGPTSEAEKILQQIKLEKKKLLLIDDLKSQFALNRKINNLYRDYKDKMDQVTTRTQSSARSKSLRASLQIKIKSPINYNKMQKSVRLSQQDKLGLKKQKRQFRHRSLKNSKFNDQDDNIKQIYFSKKDMKKYEQEQNISKYNHDLVNLYRTKHRLQKQRLEQRFSENSKINSMHKNGMVFFKDQGENEQQFDTFDQVNKLKTLAETQRKKNIEFNREMMDESKRKKEAHQKYFSTFLGKRHRKFKKPWGNKILIKYDAEVQAKEMLGGQLPRHSRSPRQSELNLNETFANFGGITKCSHKYSAVPESISDQDKWVLQRMQEEQNDQKFYHTMCKTQKINLYLKKTRNKN